MANQEKDRAYLFNDSEVVTNALAKGVRAALEQHRRAGNYVVAWRDGRVVRIEPDEISQLLTEGFSHSDAEEPSDSR